MRTLPLPPRVPGGAAMREGGEYWPARKTPALEPQECRRGRKDVLGMATYVTFLPARFARLRATAWSAPLRGAGSTKLGEAVTEVTEGLRPRTTEATGPGTSVAELPEETPSF